MPPKIHVASGSRFGSWTVLREADFHRKNRQIFYICRCDCGKIKEVGSSELRSGKSTRCQSCSNGETSMRHGESRSRKRTPEYATWIQMVNRCSSNYERFSDYGGRGIEVCSEWKPPGGFERFLNHVGRKLSSEHSIDRIDNNHGYEPGNMRWATRKEQQRNRRGNVLITIRGETKCVAEWVEELPICDATIRARLYRGWDSEAAVFTPAKGRKMLTDDMPPRMPGG